MHILGDKKNRRYNEGLFEIVNKMYAGESSNVKTSASNVSFFDDFELAFEPEKVRGPLYFNQSLKSLKTRGYQRHARPKEVFSILTDYEEKGKQSKYAALAESMLSGQAEWLSIAVRRAGKELEFALDPKNLFFCYYDRSYHCQGEEMHCAGVYRFEKINENLSDPQIIRSFQFSEGLIEFLYGRSSKDLPKKIQEGAQQANFHLPNKDCWHPVKRTQNYSVVNEFTLHAASRGVKFK